MTSRVCSKNKEKKAKRKNSVKKNRPNREKNGTKKQQERIISLGNRKQRRRESNQEYPTEPLDDREPTQSVCVADNLVPRAFPLKNGWGGKRPWHRLVTCPLVHPKILGVIN